MPTVTGPPCRVCRSPLEVICYPEDHAQTVCPECCPKTTHADGETGHGWDYSRHDRDECRYCGILRSCTDYRGGD